MPSKIILPIVIVAACTAADLWMFMQKDPPQTIDKRPPSMLVDVIRALATSERITVTAQGSVTPRTQSPRVTS